MIITESYKDYLISIDLENRRGSVYQHNLPAYIRSFERTSTGILFQPNDKLPITVIKLITHHLYSRKPVNKE